MTAPMVLGVGIIGAGEVAQVIHLPTLSLMPHLYKVVSVCDVSQAAIAHCQFKFHIPQGTTDAATLINNPEVHVVFNLTSDQFHEQYTIAALEAGKTVMLEKPLTLSMQSAMRMLAAEERAPKGARIFVGTMRRYAPSFVKAFKREVETIPRIMYARCRGLIGPNSHFVPQGGTFDQKFNDIPREALIESKAKLSAVLKEALTPEGMTNEKINFWRHLGSLGSHDLSLMRETLGFPERIAAVSLHHPFYTAILEFSNKTGEPFSCTYEAGIDNVPRFDAHLAVYGEFKTVTIQYDTPYVKGLPIKVKVDELVDGEAVTREVLSSFEDAYTAEMRALHRCVTVHEPIKTSAKDAILDLKLWMMLMAKHDESLSRGFS